MPGPMRTAHPLLDALFGAAPVGLAAWDRELRYQRVNAALAAINGAPVEDHIGRRVDEMLPDVGTDLLELLRGVIERDEALIDIEISGETSAEPGVRRTWQASYYPIHGLDGEVIGVGAVVSDITERKRAEESLARSHARSELMAATSRLLESTLDYESTLEQIAQLVVPQLADLAVVQLLRADGEIARVALAATDAEREQVVRTLDERYPLDRAAGLGAPQVIRSGLPLMQASVPEEILERNA